MKPQTLALGLALMAASGCSASASFTWRDKTYELPEEALRDQKKELTALLGEVADTLEEERLGGSCLVVIPSQKGFRASWFGNQAPDQAGVQYYQIAKAQNEAKFRIKALESAKLFSRLKLKESATPGSESAGLESWHLYASPDPATKTLKWGIRSKKSGKTQEVSDNIRSLEQDRLEKFVLAVSSKGKEADSEDAKGRKLPVGWYAHRLPPGEAKGFEMGFPVPIKRPSYEDRKHWRGWDVRGDYDKLQLFAIASQAKPGDEFVKGIESQARERVREANRSEVLIEEAKPRNDGFGESWVLFKNPNGALVLARILYSKRWLVIAGAAGEVFAKGEGLTADERLTRKTRRGKLWNRCSELIKTFLGTIEISKD